MGFAPIIGVRSAGLLSYLVGRPHTRHPSFISDWTVRGVHIIPDLGVCVVACILAFRGERGATPQDSGVQCDPARMGVQGKKVVFPRPGMLQKLP